MVLQPFLQQGSEAAVVVVLEGLQVLVMPSQLPGPVVMVVTLTQTPLADLVVQRIQPETLVRMVLAVAVVVGVSRLALQQVLVEQAVLVTNMF